MSRAAAGARHLVGSAVASPAVLVVAVMAIAALIAAAAGPAPTTSGDDRRAIDPRSGPSPGPSVVVRSDPEPSRPSAGATADGQEAETPVTDEPSRFVELAARTSTVFATDFTSIGDAWEIYDSPGHAGLGLRRPSAITVEGDPAAEGGSVLAITATMGTDGEEAGQLVSGGMALRQPQVYGTYTFRMRVDPDPAQVTSGVAILWPWSNRWPEDGELDMVETWANRATRAPVESNFHYLDPLAEPPFEASDDRLFSVVHSGLDGTAWHTCRFEWRSDRLSMGIDDGPMHQLTDDPLHIPDWLMVPTFQLDAFPAPGGSREDAVLDGPVTLEVDWLVIEE